MLSIPLTYGYIFGCVNPIQLYSINHPFEEKQKKANQNDSRKSDFGKKQKKANAKSTKAECNGKYKEQFVLFLLLLLCSYLFSGVFLHFFRTKEANKKSKNKCIFALFLWFLFNCLFVFCFFQLHFVACVG